MKRDSKKKYLLLSLLLVVSVSAYAVYPTTINFQYVKPDSCHIIYDHKSLIIPEQSCQNDFNANGVSFYVTTNSMTTTYNAVTVYQHHGGSSSSSLSLFLPNFVIQVDGAHASSPDGYPYINFYESTDNRAAPVAGNYSDRDGSYTFSNGHYQVNMHNNVITITTEYKATPAPIAQSALLPW